MICVHLFLHSFAIFTFKNIKGIFSSMQVKYYLSFLFIFIPTLLMAQHHLKGMTGNILLAEAAFGVLFGIQKKTDCGTLKIQLFLYEHRV